MLCPFQPGRRRPLRANKEMNGHVDTHQNPSGGSVVLPAAHAVSGRGRRRAFAGKRQHSVDPDRRDAGHVHAARLRTGGVRPDPGQERSQHHDEKLRRFSYGKHHLLPCRLRPDVRSRRRRDAGHLDVRHVRFRRHGRRRMAVDILVLPGHVRRDLGHHCFRSHGRTYPFQRLSARQRRHFSLHLSRQRALGMERPVRRRRRLAGRSRFH